MTTTNDLKKGTLVELRNGWTAKLQDNRKGNVRMATIFGEYHEIGSIYAHDIIKALIDDQWVDVMSTTSQQKCKQLNDSLFG